MLLRRYYDDIPAQASYLIACKASGEAVVVDPPKHADLYLAAAAADGVCTTDVTETRIHGDYVSGSSELAARTGARLYPSGHPGWLAWTGAGLPTQAAPPELRGGA